MPMWKGLGFQDGNSYLMEQLCFFNDHAMVILVLISLLVFHFVFVVFFSSSFSSGVSEGHEIEFVWTILPALLLVYIAIPSLKVLYFIEEEFSNSINYKATGHQWYWSYEYSDFLGLDYDSYMHSSQGLRLIDSEDRLYVPYYIPLKFLVTSQDVIHSWTVPTLGVKCDALPGRLNQLCFIATRPGLFFGQCSELCGANHSFMPISLESVSTDDYSFYVNSF